MKNTILSFAVLLALSAGAQTTEEASTVTTTVAATPAKLTSDNIRPEHFLPVLGHFTATGTSKENVSVTVDETNIGIVWVEGLEQGKFKALLKKSPSTYKIPAQQTESGKQLPEGTLFFDPETNQLNILLGKSFDDENPVAVFAADVKPSTKQKRYTGVKNISQE